MKTPNDDECYEDVSPLECKGDTPEERLLIATLKVLVAKGEVSESDVMNAWQFVIG